MSTSVDENKVKAWVNENLVKYDTFVPGYTSTFHSTMQGTIEVPLGDYGIYGWKTDVDATVEKLKEYILAGESVTVEPEYSQRGYCRATDDIGDSYAEVDITNQKVFVYKDGELVLRNPVRHKYPERHPFPSSRHDKRPVVLHVPDRMPDPLHSRIQSPIRHLYRQTLSGS